MNCAIYARVSTRDKGQDFTNQLLARREFAAKHGCAGIEGVWTLNPSSTVFAP